MRVLALVLAFAPLYASSAHAEPDADPVLLIKAIYKSYHSTGNGLHHGHIYSRRLQRLFDEDRKATPKGEVGKIDWDLFVNGNNWELSALKITRIRQGPTCAQVQASFDNFKEPYKKHSTILFDLVRERNHWRIDDIQSMQKPRWTVSKILTGAADAFPDEKKEGPEDKKDDK